MKKILTVLIPVYNTEKYIKRCLDSLIDESIIDNIEILIVSDGSKDNSILIAKDYEKELYKLAIRILVSHWYENRSVETVGKNVSKIAFGLDTIIVQLKYTQGDAI